jgi:threonine/homoserine/homoserine lactone efflux protein
VSTPAAEVIVGACGFALIAWIGWWIFLAPGESGDWRDGPAFSLRRRRDLLTMGILLIAGVAGAVLYVVYRLVRLCVS